MKKNNKTYVLLALVIGVWGIIGYKFFSAVNPATPKDIVQVTSDKIFIPQELKERTVFSIAANYRDPFLGTANALKTVRKASPKKVKKQLPKKSIQYTGFIGDTNSNENIFFVTVNGQQQMMSVNETFQDVKLIRGTKSSVKVKYGGTSQTIQLTE